jgi:AraC-like DNA-binding protein
VFEAEKEMISVMPEHILQLLSEELSDLAVLTDTGCLWKYGPNLLTELRLGPLRMHNSAFCFRTKEKHGLLVCKKHDTETLAKYIRSSDPRPRLFRCPAGADEFLIPVINAGRILGAVLCGPFRGETDRRELPVWRNELAQALERCVAKRIAPLCRELYLAQAIDDGGDPRIAAVIDHISAHFAENITLQQAAAKVFLSPSRLSHLFKEKCGEDFSTYLTRIRIREAEALLRDTACSIEEAALRSGFNDRSHFTLIFKKYNGLPPARYRRQAREEFAFLWQQTLKSDIALATEDQEKRGVLFVK